MLDDWFLVRKYHLESTRRDGRVQKLTRLCMDRGDRAAVLLCSKARGTVVLTSQFRVPALLHGSPAGQLLEVPGGLLDEADAYEAVRREAEEETGFRVGELRKVFTTCLAPQLSSERTHLFTGGYEPETRAGTGGGVADEGEDIGVVELPLVSAIDQVTRQPAADAKTLLLLLHVQNQGLCADQGRSVPPQEERKFI